MPIATEKFEPDWVSPPGATIEDCLEERGLTRRDLDLALEVPTDFSIELLEGQRVITEDIAKRLEAMFEVPASFWLNRERQYREGQYRLAQKRFDPHFGSKVSYEITMEHIRAAHQQWKNNRDANLIE